ncbi:hypothetical protein H4R34_003901 [Dimargaris verticillata]|uniref:Sm domain-containing protein n=1 Tax=Dimargaris verticillata TaxID=2761393 RepID=A0A9W8AZ67_9FUNG|nr:hypothetical protein H4R34_003901 [Dimargaris verticillata]
MAGAKATGAIKAPIPELKGYMEKRLVLKLNGNRKVSGVLRGYDPFMNIVLDDARDETAANGQAPMGMIVVRAVHQTLAMRSAAVVNRVLGHRSGYGLIARYYSATPSRFTGTGKVDSLVLGIHQDQDVLPQLQTKLPAALAKQLADQSQLAKARGKLGECHVFYPTAAGKAESPFASLNRVALVGLGRLQLTSAAGLATNYTGERYRRALATGLKALKRHGAGHVGVAADDQAHVAGEASALALFYDSFQKKATAAKPDDNTNLAVSPVVVTPNQLTVATTSTATANSSAWAQGQAYGQAQNFARRLADMPANFMTPRLFCAQVQQQFAGLNHVTLHERDEAWASDQKMGCFLGVAQASAEPLRFLEIHYRGNPSASDTVDLGLVGKGVTFDTGGIDLKPSAGMVEMKGDMGGAACVAATMYGIATLQLPLNVYCAIPLCENMPGGKAIKPGDVLHAKNGLSVEILNTDAEGRLILADALYYTSTQYRPKALVDVATLTGAMMVALGSTYTGVFTNSDQLWQTLQQASDNTHELLWRCPMHPEYREGLLQTRVADIANITQGRAAGACSAAMFLREFVGQSPLLKASEGEPDASELEVETQGHPIHYAHIDMAGTMDSTSNDGYHTKGMSGK